MEIKRKNCPEIAIVILCTYNVSTYFEIDIEKKWIIVQALSLNVFNTHLVIVRIV